MIRAATTDDVPALVALVERFHADGAYPPQVRISPAQIGITLLRLIENPFGQVLLAATGEGVTVGLLALVLFTHHFSGLLTAGECVFFVDPASRGAGLRLLRAGETWAKAQGACELQLVAPEGAARVEQFYAAVDYVPVERAWTRML